MLFTESLRSEVSGGDCPPLSTCALEYLEPQLKSTCSVPTGFALFQMNSVGLKPLNLKIPAAPTFCPGFSLLHQAPGHLEALTTSISHLCLDHWHKCWTYMNNTPRDPLMSQDLQHPTMFEHLTRPDGSWTESNALEKSRYIALSQFPFWSRNAILSRRQNVYMTRFIFLTAGCH